MSELRGLTTAGPEDPAAASAAALSAQIGLVALTALRRHYG